MLYYGGKMLLFLENQDSNNPKGLKLQSSLVNMMPEKKIHEEVRCLQIPC